ncbi:MAG: hypothetical protein V2I43_18115 [Parvularcula sp.]|jgi:hypothetical protein|nr:hypothetical protein [Parvularcula sp.]
MTGYELLDLMAENRNAIYETWYFFLSVHMAVFGIVYIARGYTHIIERFVMIGAYACFTYVNFRGQQDNYLLQANLVEEVRALASEPIAQRLVEGDQSMWISAYLPHLYIAAGVCSALIILFINRGDDLERA